MFGPDFGGCPSCSNCRRVQLGPFSPRESRRNADGGVAGTAQATGVQASAGWTFPWASSFGSDFNDDFSVHATEQQQTGGRYTTTAQRPMQAGAPAQIVASSRRVQHRCTDIRAKAWREYVRAGGRRGVSRVGLRPRTGWTMGMYQSLDRAPKGRNKKAAGGDAATGTPTAEKGATAVMEAWTRSRR
jgi:predicted dithiol-disulfide oxidoreductase (DUF899 family)